MLLVNMTNHWLSENVDVDDALIHASPVFGNEQHV